MIMIERRAIEIEKLATRTDGQTASGAKEVW